LAQNSAPARKLYGFAALQAALACVAELTVAKICSALRKTKNYLSKN